MGMYVRSSETRLISVDIKMTGWIWMNPHHSLITFVWDVLNVNANRMISLRILRRCLNHEFPLEQQKNYPDCKNLTHKLFRQHCHVGNTAPHCKKQNSVSHSSTESEIISLDAGLRMDGLPALDLWDMVIEVPTFNQQQCPTQTCKPHGNWDNS